MPERTADHIVTACLVVGTRGGLFVRLICAYFGFARVVCGARGIVVFTDTLCMSGCPHLFSLSYPSMPVTLNRLKMCEVSLLSGKGCLKEKTCSTWVIRLGDGLVVAALFDCLEMKLYV